MKPTFSLVFSLCMTLLAPTAQADLVGGVNVIAAWQRLPGQYSDVENPDRGKVMALDPFALKKALRVRRMVDLQYGDRRSYHGVSLEALITAYKHRGSSDLIILHFENGMQIPLQLRDVKRLDAFVAIDACDARGKNCTTSFDTVDRRDVYGQDEDPAPLKFSWNKLVISKPWHPGTGTLEPGSFVPWRHVNSLAGIEFADREAYDRQFVVGKSGGEMIFQKRCQYCHGARSVGARFGWDFVTPLALHEKRPAGNLLNHVKYQKAMAPRLGIQMPPQKDVEIEEIEMLWQWMRDVAHKPLQKYQP